MLTHPRRNRPISDMRFVPFEYAGPTGPTGYTGYTGAASTAVGETGPTGYTGPGNFTGYTGYTGSTGFTGYTGYTGAGNFTGFTGYTGYTGYTGAGNFTGFTGYTGYTGATGYTGYTGGSAQNIVIKNSPTDQTASGVLITKVAGMTLAFGETVYFSRAGKANKAFQTSGSYPAIGIIHSAAAAGSVAGILVHGTLKNVSGFNLTSIGGAIYLSTLTAGGLDIIRPHNSGNILQILGRVSPDADTIYFAPSPDYFTIT